MVYLAESRTLSLRWMTCSYNNERWPFNPAMHLSAKRIGQRLNKYITNISPFRDVILEESDTCFVASLHLSVGSRMTGIYFVCFTRESRTGHKDSPPNLGAVIGNTKVGYFVRYDPNIKKQIYYMHTRCLRRGAFCRSLWIAVCSYDNKRSFTLVHGRWRSTSKMANLRGLDCSSSWPFLLRLILSEPRPNITQLSTVRKSFIFLCSGDHSLSIDSSIRNSRSCLEIGV